MKLGWLLAGALMPAAAMAQLAGVGSPDRPDLPRRERFSETVFSARWTDADRDATGDDTKVSNGGLTNYPGQPRAEPLSETVFGVDIDDPYRWMEKLDRRSEMESWINASSDHATKELSALPGRAQLLRDLVEASQAGDAISSVSKAGDKLFYEKLSREGGAAVLMVREKGRDRMLLDPLADAPAGSIRSIASYAPSPDGNRVAITIGDAANQIGPIHFFDVATGKPLPDVVGPSTLGFSGGWLDAQTYIYSRLPKPGPGVDVFENIDAFLHVMGTSVDADKPILGPGVRTKGFVVPPRQGATVSGDAKTNWVMGLVVRALKAVPLGIARASDLKAGKREWVSLADYDDRVNSSDIAGNTLYYTTSKFDPKGEVRSLDLNGPISLTSSKPLLSGQVFWTVTATTDGAYAVGQLPSGEHRLYFVRKGQRVPVEVRLPKGVQVKDVAVSTDRASITFAISGYTQNDTYYVATGGRAVPLGLGNDTLPAARARTVVEDTAISADGTRVPLTIVYSGKRNGPAPTILNVYGGYGNPGFPTYTISWVVWTARGGVYAYCHTRGGGELGDDWHWGGAKQNKPRAQEDTIACGERLIELGYATKKTLGLYGGSAAGTLVPPAALKRPDLFAAAVTRAGVVNPTRFLAANNGANQFDEMGDPRTEAGFKALAEQDSGVLLRRATGGTDFMFVIGLSDVTVDPWESAKIAAMMRAKWGNQHLVLLRAEPKGGHGYFFGTSVAKALEERADIFAFFLNRFGAPDFAK